MTLPEYAKRLESAVRTASIAGRTLLALDTNPVPASWDHVTKVDPEHGKELPLAFPLFLAHTSAISVGGSQDVTDRNTEETFDLVSAASVPALHEPSAAGHVTEATRDHADYLAVPEVLNGDSEALVGTLGRGIEYVREELGPQLVEEKLGIPLDGDGFLGQRVANFAAAYLMEESIFEAYIIMNTDSAAAREANVTEDDLLTPQQAKERALAAEYHLESEIIYLEYSGTFGGEEATEMLEAISDGVSWSRIWYGGGLDSRENVQAVLDAGADTVVVGDVFHDIATEEAELVEQAREAFEEVPDDEALREWVEERVEVSETSAIRYLSTIPTVSNPVETAATYLATGVGIALEIEALADELDTPSVAGLRRELRDGPVPGESAFEDVLGTDARPVARRLTATLLAEQFDLETDDAFASRQLAVEL